MNLEERYDCKKLLTYSINRVSLLYRRRLYTEFLALCIDLRPEQWQLLMLLHNNPGMIQSEIASCIDKDPTNITRSLDSMARAGYLERQADHGDRRCYHVYLTQKGVDTVNLLLPAARAVNLAMQDGLSEEDLIHMKRILGIILQNLGDTLIESDMIMAEKRNNYDRKREERIE